MLSEVSRHLLIGGTGRAGTSFLVRLLDALGMDTHLGRRGDKASWFDGVNAGLEDIMVEGGPKVLPYVVKSPSLTEFVEPLLNREDIAIDGVIIPVRNLMDAAKSRCVQEVAAIHAKAPWMTKQPQVWRTWGFTPGGVLASTDPHDQAEILAVGFFHLIDKLVAADIPIYFLSFPRMIYDPEYTYKRLRGCLPQTVTKEQVISAHSSVADPEKVRVGKEDVASNPTVEVAALKLELERTRQREREARAEIERLKAEGQAK